MLAVGSCSPASVLPATQAEPWQPLNSRKDLENSLFSFFPAVCSHPGSPPCVRSPEEHVLFGGKCHPRSHSCSLPLCLLTKFGMSETLV